MTLREQLKQLPISVRELALRNYDAYSQRYAVPTHERESVGEALNAAFAWHRTKQGAAYWLDAYNEVMNLTCALIPDVPVPHVHINAIKLDEFFEF